MRPSPSTPSPFVRGMLEFMPFLPGVIPFGLVVGVAQVQAGLSLLESVGMSAIGFAGSAQLIASQMVQGGAPLLLILLLAAATVNLRFAMYSAVLRERFQPFATWAKALNGFLLTDQSFALFISKLGGLNPRERQAYALGTATLMYISWQLSTLIGSLLGKVLPPSWSLDFAVTLTFIALGVPAVKSRPTLTAACAGGLATVLAAGLPFKLNLLIGAAVGIGGGLLAQHFSSAANTTKAPE